jgi:hypothetical protein
VTNGDVDPAGELDRGLEDVVMRQRDLLVGMDGIAMAGERGNLEPARADGGDEFGELAVIGQQLIGLAMGIARIGAGADLDTIAFQAGDVIEGLVQREMGENRGENADFHKGRWLVVGRLKGKI